MWTHAYVDRIAMEALQQIERPDPEPGPGQIVIRMEAVALNYRDLAIARGNYHIGVTPPLVPLSDGAGRVVASGQGVTRFHVGDLVCPTYLPDWIDGPVSARVARRRLGGPSDGVLSEFLCIDEEDAVLAPPHLSAEEAATLPVAAVTAWQCLHVNGQVRPGEVVLVQGAGAVSTATIQLAGATGARVISSIRRESQAEAVRALGADEVIVGAGSDLANEVRRRTAELGADSVIEVAGGSSLGRSIEATRMGGRVHLVGYAAETEARFDIFEAIRHAVTLHVATAGPRASFEALVRAMTHLALRPAIARIFPRSELLAAFSQLAEGGSVGKLVVRV